MRLADIQRVNELAGERRRLDEFAGPAVLMVGGGELELNADETADFVEWKRGRIDQELRRLGITQDGDAGGSPAIQYRGPAGDAGTTPSERPAAQTAAQTDAPAPARRPSPLTYDEAYAEARESLIGAYAADQQVLSDDPDIDREVRERIARYEAKRRPEIEALAREMMAAAAPPPVCAECDEPVTAVIGGIGYCPEHAGVAARPERPSWLRRVIDGATG